MMTAERNIRGHPRPTDCEPMVQKVNMAGLRRPPTVGRSPHNHVNNLGSTSGQQSLGALTPRYQTHSCYHLKESTHYLAEK